MDGEMVFICCACSEERGCDMTSYDEPDFPWERRGQPKIELPRGPSPEELAEAEALASATGSEVEEELEPVLALDHVGVEDE